MTPSATAEDSFKNAYIQKIESITEEKWFFDTAYAKDWCINTQNSI